MQGQPRLSTAQTSWTFKRKSKGKGKSRKMAGLDEEDEDAEERPGVIELSALECAPCKDAGDAGLFTQPPCQLYHVEMFSFT